MKRVRWLNIGMFLLLIVAALASAGSALAEVGGTPGLVVVKKTAVTTFDRVYDWKIVKSADVKSLTLSPGQVIDVNYDVTVSATRVDSNWNVKGLVAFLNQTSEPVMINSVSDVMSDGTVVPLTCSKTFPMQLAAGASISCSYDIDLPNGDARTNFATVSSSIGDFTAQAAVVFGTPTNVTDECIDVSDTLAPGSSLGTVCAGEAPKTFAYTVEVGPYAKCGVYEVKNTASFVTNDTKETGSVTVKIPVDVPCAEGCSLTPGYWKTHSINGPAPYDNTWAQIGETTTFFSSGKSYYNVLWTSPRGNAYYILAHAYIAAELNELNGADFSAAQAAFDAATALFNNPANTPEFVGGLKGSAKAEWTNLATILDNYNNGLIGPGHCSE
jgi:hypothetical protein